MGYPPRRALRVGRRASGAARRAAVVQRTTAPLGQIVTVAVHVARRIEALAGGGD